MVNVTLAGLDPGVTEAAEKLQLAPVGSPLQASLIELENAPPTGDTANEYAAFEPAFTVAEVLEAVSAKSTPVPLN